MRPVALTALVLVALAQAAAGSGADGPTRLSIRIWPNEHRAASVRYTVGCRPTRGRLPRAAAACARLASGGPALFTPPPPTQACTAIYGGPQRAIVSGKVGGRRIWVSLRRRDGCEIDRWRRLAFLLPISI